MGVCNHNQAPSNLQLPTHAPFFPTLAAFQYTEGHFDSLKVIEGQLPTTVRGLFCRNGPNPHFSTEGLDYHAFDGDGMIHCVALQNGKASYTKRWIQTRKKEVSTERGYDVFGFGEMNASNFSNLGKPKTNARTFLDI
jgi:carotenoid cleavage dioxygenase-like enzyme